MILSVGNQISLDELSALIKSEDIRAEILIVPFIDQIAVLEKADVFLSHCGMNSVSEALYYEVPLVMFPQTNEQKGVAFRVDELGAGVYLKDTSVERIKEAFSTVIVDSAYKKQAKEISEGFKKCGGYKAAVEKILSVI